MQNFLKKTFSLVSWNDYPGAKFTMMSQEQQQYPIEYLIIQTEKRFGNPKKCFLIFQKFYAISYHDELSWCCDDPNPWLFVHLDLLALQNHWLYHTICFHKQWRLACYLIGIPLFKCNYNIFQCIILQTAVVFPGNKPC